MCEGQGFVRVTAPFNKMRTPKFKAQPTNAFFAAVNQMIGGSSQLQTTAERCFYHETFYSRQLGQAYPHRIKI